MALSDGLSTRTQEAVLASLPAQHKDNLKSAAKRGAFVAAGIAGFALSTAFAPAAILPLALFAATAVTIIAGAKLVGNASRALSLIGIKMGVKNDNFVPRLKKKAGNAMKNATFFNKVSNYAFWGVLGAFVAGMSVAAAPLAGAVYAIAMPVMFASWAAAEWSSGTAQGTRPTAKLVYDRQVAEGVIRPAEDILPPGASLQRAPQQSQPKSILGMFRRKAAGEKPKEPAKKLVAVPKPPQP